MYIVEGKYNDAPSLQWLEMEGIQIPKWLEGEDVVRHPFTCYKFVLRIGCDVLRQDLDVIQVLALRLCILSYKNVFQNRGYTLGIVPIG